VGLQTELGVRAGLGPGESLPAGRRLEDGMSLANGHTAADITPGKLPTIAAFRYALALPLLLLPTAMPALALRSLWQIPGGVWLSPLVYYAVYFLTTAALLRWLHRPQGSIARGGWAEVRWWLGESLWVDTSATLFPLLATSFTSSIFRLFGARVGRDAEISTAEHINPTGLTLGTGAFLADAVSMGACRVTHQSIDGGPVSIGQRSFVGNNSVVPPNAVIGDAALLGVLSVAPAAMAAGHGSWLGIPALRLPRRADQATATEQQTYQPHWQVRLCRGVMEATRTLLPSAAVLYLVYQLFLHPANSVSEALVLAAKVALLCALVGVSATLVAKWLLTGRVRPHTAPLWNSKVWRLEWVAVWHEWLAWTNFLQLCSGTPWLNLYYRALGARIGKRVYCDTRFVTEYDLISLADDVAVNADADLQTHLFEDRVMKCGPVTLQSRSSIGTTSVVLYNATVSSDATLQAHSLLMKGEVLPPNTHWQGSPAQAVF
jgi:non-ribosomal peptide synthetase-like protein